jgi:hypothetical protein
MISNLIERYHRKRSPQMEAARQLYESEIEMLHVEMEKEAIDAKRGKLNVRIARLKGYLKRAADDAVKEES